MTGNRRHPVRRSLSQSQFISAQRWLFSTEALNQPHKIPNQLIQFICKEKSYWVPNQTPNMKSYGVAM